MTAPGRNGQVTLHDGRILEYWDGGDPSGRPMLYQPGTPVTRLLGQWGHDAAASAGVRLLALNRPGYGGSTPLAAPMNGLGAIGRDTAELARLLGLTEYVVFGSSGGGPFAVATALAAPDAVRVVGLIGGVGPWRDLEPPSYGLEDRACLALADTGDVAGAWACLSADVEQRRRDQRPEQAAADILGDERTAVTSDSVYRALWAENMRSIQAQPTGYIFDNLAWGRAWDIDPRDVAAPAFLLYGEDDRHCSASRHGRWYADRLRRAELVVVPGAAHFAVIDGHWPQVLAGLLRNWA